MHPSENAECPVDQTYSCASCLTLVIDTPAGRPHADLRMYWQRVQAAIVQEVYRCHVCSTELVCERTAETAHWHFLSNARIPARTRVISVTKEAWQLNLAGPSARLASASL
jgi:hypothetical protein